MTTLDELTLIREQYRYIRKNAIQDFRNSSYVVPFTEDAMIPPGGTAEAQYRKIYSKGFGHTGPNGNTTAPIFAPYALFLNGVENNKPLNIQSTNNTRRRLVDTYCLYDNDFIGPYASSYTIPPAPLIGSYQAAAELLEVYAMSLVRDIPFQIINDSSIPIPILDNTILPDLNRPNVKNYLGAPVDSSGNITRELLFRGNAVGDNVGPYVSQLLFCDIQLGTYLFSQDRYITLQKVDISGNDINFKNDFMKSINDFVKVWNGDVQTIPVTPTTTRYLTTPRDCGYYINKDQIWQMFNMAAAAMLSRGVRTGFFCTPRAGAKFISLGPIDIYDLMSRAAKLAMNASWLWKWRQMKVRPEEMAYQLNYNLKVNPSDPYNVNFADTLDPLDSLILQKINDISGIDYTAPQEISGNYLLPQMYSYGSPFHASYPSGHATYGGALSTILKAFFNCDYYIDSDEPDLELREPFCGKCSEKTPQSGSNLKASPLPPGYTGSAYLKLEGEINKLASNCADFRNIAGIHYRSDAEAGLSIGEQAAIILLEDVVKKYNANLAFVFRKRNGEKVVIKNYNGPDPPPTNYTSYIFDPLDYRGGDPATTIYSTAPDGLIPGSPTPPIPSIPQTFTVDLQFTSGLLPVPVGLDDELNEDPGITYTTINQS
jgi:hypothetical protein